jgi:hypothetical protein
VTEPVQRPSSEFSRTVQSCFTWGAAIAAASCSLKSSLKNMLGDIVFFSRDGAAYPVSLKPKQLVLQRVQ